MKLIIHLASHDDDAVLNYSTLMRIVGSEIGVKEYHSKIYFDKDRGKLIDPDNLLRKLSIHEKSTNEIFFMAHGTLGHPDFIVQKPPGPTTDTVDPDDIKITPDHIHTYLNSNGTENGEYKFDKLTVLACCGDNFGRSLSNLVRNVNILCFNEPVSVRVDGEIHNSATKKIVKPLCFWNGNPKVENQQISDDKKVDLPAQMDILEQFDPLYEPPLLLRVNPYEKYKMPQLSELGRTSESDQNSMNDANSPNSSSDPFDDNEDLNPSSTPRSNM